MKYYYKIMYNKTTYVLLDITFIECGHSKFLTPVEAEFDVGGADFVVFSPTHILSGVGNLSQLKISGQGYPNFFIKPSQPLLAERHKCRHGGIGSSSMVQTGA